MILDMDAAEASKQFMHPPMTDSFSLPALQAAVVLGEIAKISIHVRPMSVAGTTWAATRPENKEMTRARRENNLHLVDDGNMVMKEGIWSGAKKGREREGGGGGFLRNRFVSGVYRVCNQSS